MSPYGKAGDEDFKHILVPTKHTAVAARAPGGAHGRTADGGRSESQRGRKAKKLEKGVWGALLDTDPGSWLEWPYPSRLEKEQGPDLSETCRHFEKSGPYTCE